MVGVAHPLHTRMQSWQRGIDSIPGKPEDPERRLGPKDVPGEQGGLGALRPRGLGRPMTMQRRVASEPVAT
jgi:hypothetical protein